MESSEKNLNTALETANQLHRSALRLSRLMVNGTKGISLSKLSVMGYLFRRGATNATELAAFMRIQPQSLTRLIADLERRKWITRRPNDLDRRQMLLELTETGAGLLIEDVRLQREALAQVILKALTETEQDMLRVAAGLMDRLATETEANHNRAQEQVRTRKIRPLTKK